MQYLFSAYALYCWAATSAIMYAVIVVYDKSCTTYWDHKRDMEAPAVQAKMKALGWKFYDDDGNEV